MNKKKAIRVAVDASPMYAAGKTGHGYYISGLLSGFASISDIELVKLVPPAHQDFNTISRWYRDQYQLPRQATAARADILQLTAFSVPSHYRGRMVAIVHDLALKIFPQNMRGLSGWFLRDYVPGTLKRADHLLAISESTKRDAVEMLGIPEDKITVVYAGVDAFYRPSEAGELERVLNKYKLTKNKYLLFVSTLEPRKNVEFLVDAVAPLLKKDSTLRLVLAGKRGWQYQTIFDSIARNHITEQVIITGYITEQEKRGLYSGAAMLCYPSKYEGFGLPITEAFACGCPVVTADNSSLPEIAGSAGLVLPLEIETWRREITALLDDASRRQRMIRSGVDRAKQFSWDKAAGITAAVYRKVMER